MANSPQRNVSSHVLVVFRKNGVGQHHYYLDHRHQCYLLQTDNDDHSWLPPLPRLSSPTYWSVSSPVCLAPPPFPPCPSPLSVAMFKSSQFLSLFLLCLLSPSLSSVISSPPPPSSPSPPLPSPSHPSLSLSVPFANCLHIFLFVSLF